MSNMTILESNRYQSFSGCDMVVSVDAVLPDGTKVNQVVGSLATLTYSIFMNKAPVRSLGNVNAKDYLFGPRTIAGTLIFTVFNKHWFHELLVNNNIAVSEMNYVVDELPPMNVTVSMANEYGKTAKMALYGIRIVSEGMTLAMNDIYIENTYQYVATGIDYLTSSDTATGSNKTVANNSNSSNSINSGNTASTVTTNSGTTPVLVTSNNNNNTTVADTSSLTDEQKALMKKRAEYLIQKIKEQNAKKQSG